MVIKLIKFWWKPTSEGAFCLTIAIERYMEKAHLLTAIEYLTTIEVLRKPEAAKAGGNDA